ncbi:hypothetical protein KZ555_003984 [Escherichia coli]|nr:hypothetical protein [Escherichia coli]
MSQGCASGDVRLLTLRDEMQRDGEWAREELARRRAARIATVQAALEDDDNADT